MELYEFQKQVARHLRAGKNVILQAPTGSGKTMAALWPYLEAWDREQSGFPRKCLYAVPMRVLANQFERETKRMVEKEMVLAELPDIRIQTGEHAKDPNLAADLTFATIDQVLSSFLLSPYSLPHRLGNLNAGAVAASYLVFDEFHLFDPISTLPTTLEMLRMLRGVTPFLLMTATFSYDMLQGLASALNAAVVPEDGAARAAMQDLPSQKKTRRYHVAREPLSAESVLAQHESRTMVVCNVVDRARALFEALRQHPKRGDTSLMLLHSRFLPEDRQRVESDILRLFGKGGERSGRWIVVATQVVEVGLDITCQTLHTELAPANSVLQRAGRCARYPDTKGDVIIYPETLDTDGGPVDLTERVLPYKSLRDEVARTLRQVRSRNGAALTFSDEQDIISAVHGSRDRAIVDGLIATRETHRRRMTSVMSGQRTGEAGDLIRAVSSRLVVVHDEPLTVLERPFAAEAFSLHPGTVYGLVNRWLEWERELGLEDWGVRVLRDSGDEDEDGRSTYLWVPLDEGNKSDVAGSVMVLVHPELAGYDPDLGFVPDRGTGYRARIASPGDERHRPAYSYRLESYSEHVQLVYQAFRHYVWPELAQAATRLERTLEWPAGVVERVAHLAVLFHDAGKLNRDWQQWVTRYQRSIGQPAPEGFHAHTDFDPGNPLQRGQQQALGRKPPHAAEGAVAVAPLLAAAVDDCEPVFNAAFTAIARHHGAFTHTYRRYVLATGADEAVAETLSWLPSPLAAGLDAGELLVSEDPVRTPVGELYVDPQDDGQFLAYAIIARALRLADQAGTMMGNLRR